MRFFPSAFRRGTGLTVLGLAALLCSSCFRQDVRTIVVEVPQMRSEECARIVQDALVRTEGIKAAKPDIAAGRISVTYNALTLAIKNIEFVIAGAGFDANDTPAPADVRAKLPEPCR